MSLHCVFANSKKKKQKVSSDTFVWDCLVSSSSTGTSSLRMASAQDSVKRDVPHTIALQEMYDLFRVCYIFCCITGQCNSLWRKHTALFRIHKLIDVYDWLVWISQGWEGTYIKWSFLLQMFFEWRKKRRLLNLLVHSVTVNGNDT